MPGIAGVVSQSGANVDDRLLQAMIGTMLHEPSYSSGSYINAEIGVSVGWVSHQGSFSDCMPVWNENHDVCLLFSGEDHRDKEDVAGLHAKGHKCGHSNAEYIVHLYEEFGDGVFEALNGWFSGVLVDLAKQQAVLFNDRYGLGRIYYHETAERLYFASEAKALLKVVPHLRKLDARSLAEFFALGCVLQNRAFFDNVFLLPGGSAWTFSPGQTKNKRTYFTPAAWEEQPKLGRKDYYDALKETFAHVLPRYFDADGKMAMSLTGGVDSRMIMSWAELCPEALPCYTFAGAYRDCADVRIARRVASVCGQEHKTIRVEEAFLSEFPLLAEKAIYVSDGCMDVTGAVELFVNRVAREIAPIRLTGNYGGEVLRGLVAFRAGQVNESMFDPDFGQLVASAAETYNQETQCNRSSFIAFKQVPWHHFSRLAVEQSQLTVRTPYLDNDLVALTYRDPQHLGAGKELFLRLIIDGRPALGRIETDRAAGSRSVPVMRGLHRLCRGLTIKAEYAYDYGMPQWLSRLDRLMIPLHPERLFLGRHKFYHFRVWYRDRLHQYIRDVLLDPQTISRPYFRREIVQKIVAEHLKGNQNHTVAIHKMLSAELIQRQFVG